MIRIKACGEFRVDEPVQDRGVGGGLARELLALLVVRHGVPVTTARIVDLLWDDEPPATASTIVHGAVARLRRALGAGAVRTTDDGYRLDPAMVAVDLWTARNLLDAGQWAEANAILAEPVLGKFRDRPWAASMVDAVPDRPGGALVRAPSPVARLVGRRRELSAVREALRRSRMVTITGMGGVGKTRLAAEVASELATTPTIGGASTSEVVTVDLGRGSGSFGDRALAAMGAVIARDSATTTRNAVSALVADADVIVIDGCEHDLDGSATEITHLLGRFPEMSVLATSHVPLGVAGEQVVPLLPFPDPGDPFGDAVGLLIDRVQALGLPVTIEDRHRAARVCERCAGVPLAIELAATELLGAQVDSEFAPLSVRPRDAVRDAARRAVSALTPPAAGAARAAALLAGGVSPALLAAFDPVGGTAVTRELLTAGLLVAEFDGGTRRFHLPDSVRAATLDRVGSADVDRVASALCSIGSPASPPGGRLAPPEILAPAIAELDSVALLLPLLRDNANLHGHLQLALAFRIPWFEAGVGAQASREILETVEALDVTTPLDPVTRAEAICGVFEAAGSFEATAELVHLVGPAAAPASAAGRDDLLVQLHYAEACGLGYLGQHALARKAVAATRIAADRSGDEALLLRADGLDALVVMMTGSPESARPRLIQIADRCREQRWFGAAARIRLVASHAARAIGMLDDALFDLRVADELAAAGHARSSLAWIRAEIIEVELQRHTGDDDVASAESLRSTLLSALEAMVPAGHLRNAGLCRLRLGLLDKQLDLIAGAALDLVDVDGNAAALALAHVIDRLAANHPLRHIAPRVLPVLATSGGPLSKSDAAFIERWSDTTGSPPRSDWGRAVEDELRGILSPSGV